MFKERLLSYQSLKCFSLVKNINPRTLRYHYRCLWQEDIKQKTIDITNQNLIIDGFFLNKNCVVLIARIIKKVVGWKFCERENYLNWFNFLSSLKGQPLSVTCDGQKGMIKAIREVFPQTLIQRCIFHLLLRTRQLLTLNPKSLAGKQLNNLIKRIPKISTNQDLSNLIKEYKYFNLYFNDFLKEKTFNSNTNYLNKRKWFYTHSNIRSANYQLRHNLPYFFRFLTHPSIPKTTNTLEGGINSVLQELLHRHRGLLLDKQIYLVKTFLSEKQ